MSNTHIIDHLRQELENLKSHGLYKRERLIQTPQGSAIRVGGQEVINFCANNYLGLANHPAIVEAAHEGLRKYGYGLSSVRFICGTQDLHKQLEAAIAKFFGKEDAILYTSCFDANGGLFEPLLGDEDAIISDELNHASIIDGVRLCKARRYRFRHGDMNDLRKLLTESKDCRFRMIATDSVSRMDGDFAKLPDICDLADEFNALVMIDDCHATGFVGAGGRGAAEHLGVLDRIDIITSTLGKALGGAAGGFTTGRKEVIDWLRNRSRPYLFSNALPPPIGHGVDEGPRTRRQCHRLANPPAHERPQNALGIPGRRFHHQARRTPDHSRHALRRSACHQDGRPPARTGHLCHRLQLPRRPARPGPHPVASFRRPHRRAGGPYIAELRGGWKRVGRDQINLRERATPPQSRQLPCKIEALEQILCSQTFRMYFGVPMELNLERVRQNAHSASTEELLDRVTVYRNGMEPAAIEVIEDELARRGVSEEQIRDFEATRAR